MSDYWYVITHVPLYLYHLSQTVVAFTVSRPWPSGEMIFTSTALLVIMYIPRLLMHIFMPEEKVAYVLTSRFKRKKRSKFIPTASEHKAGAAVVIDSILHTH